MNDRSRTVVATPAELTDGDLDQAAAGASGLPTGKRQHKPVSLAKPAGEASDLGGGATITFTGLE